MVVATLGQCMAIHYEHTTQTYEVYRLPLFNVHDAKSKLQNKNAKSITYLTLQRFILLPNYQIDIRMIPSVPKVYNYKKIYFRG